MSLPVKVDSVLSPSPHHGPREPSLGLNKLQICENEPVGVGEGQMCLCVCACMPGGVRICLSNCGGQTVRAELLEKRDQGTLPSLDLPLLF